ncbi:prohibitin family protein [candidate division WOR-3 bacterium]|nr:prohibitin family protein [candidate division WOR-3 bacterium]
MLVFLFVICLIVGIIMLSSPEMKRNPQGKLIPFGVMFLSFIFLVASMVRLVPPGNVGVVIVFGKVQETTLKNGLHLVNPFASVEKMSIRTEEYTMSGMPREGQVKGDDAIEALTSEGLMVRLDVTVWHKLVPEGAAEVYSTLGLNYVDKIVRPAARTSIRNIISNYKVEDIYTQNREAVSIQISENLRAAVKDRNVEIERVLLRDVKLPAKVQNEIDAKMAAKQEAEKMEFVLDKEKREAERKAVEAKGVSDYNKIIAQSLSGSYLQWYYIKTLQQLVNSPNNTVIVTPFDQKLTPLLNIPTGGGK